MWIAASLWWNYFKTGEEGGTSVMPTIPFIPIIFVLIALVLNILGFEHGIFISSILSFLLFLVSFIVFVYAIIKSKDAY